MLGFLAGWLDARYNVKHNSLGFAVSYAQTLTGPVLKGYNKGMMQYL